MLATLIVLFLEIIVCIVLIVLNQKIQYKLTLGAYTDCTQYKSKSGCTGKNGQKLGCQWDGSSCSAGSGPSPPSPPSPPTPIPSPPSGQGANAMMGGNDWILMIKLGRGGSNCTPGSVSKSQFSCRYLKATSSDPTLKLITDHTVDSAVESNPAYQFYQATRNNKFVSWNDQANAVGVSNECDGGSGGAHDKGSVVYDSNGGVYLQSSCPAWGFWDQGFMKSCSGPVAEQCMKKKGSPLIPGVQTDLAQHLLFVNIPSSTDLKTLATLMTNANLCAFQGSLPGFTPCRSNCTAHNTDEGYMKEQVGKVQIISKPRGNRGDDVWKYLNNKECGNGGINVISFQATKEDDSGVTDVCPSETSSCHKEHGMEANRTGSFLNTDCLSGTEFDAFGKNHSKMGVCDDKGSDVVLIGGNNHAPSTQGPRGGMFVLINSQPLANSLRCMFSSKPK